MGGHKYTFAQNTCIKKAGLLLQRTGALWPGCRVGIAISGGVDSFVLLKVMKIRRAITPFAFDIMALHCNPGFDPADHAALIPWLMLEGLASHVETADFGSIAHSAANREKSPCFLCAWHRRKKLFALCAQYGLTHLALGHNADDLLATFMMNFMRNGRVAGMSMNESFFGGQLRLIRPLMLVEKKYIRQAARQWGLPVWGNSCPSSGHTARIDTEDVVKEITRVLPNARRSMLNALMRWQLAQEEADGGNEAKP